MAKKVKIKGKLRLYMILLVALGVFLGVLNVPIYLFDIRAGIAVSVFLLLYFLGLLLFWFYIRNYIVEELVSFATEYGQVQKQILRELRLPHALLDSAGKVLWTNAAFENLTGVKATIKKNLWTIFPEITKDKFPNKDSEEEEEYSLEFDERFFRGVLKRINISEMVKNSAFIDSVDAEECLYGFYLFDETALKIALQENDDQSLAVGFIYLDNYEEALEGVEEVRSSLLLALIERKINKYIASIDGIVKKIEKDKFMVILRKKAVTQLKEQRFVSGMKTKFTP